MVHMTCAYKMTNETYPGDSRECQRLKEKSPVHRQSKNFKRLRTFAESRVVGESYLKDDSECQVVASHRGFGITEPKMGEISTPCINYDFSPRIGLML